MSDRSALTELANFVGRSSLAADDFGQRRRAVNGMANRLLRPQRRSVGELLGAVLALSARTRRMVQPPASIDIDVFAPGGKRALRMSFGHH